MSNIFIKNVHILKGEEVIKDGCIYIEDEYIKYCGESVSKEVLGISTFEKTIDGKNMLAMPGLSNCHCHSPMTLFRNYADDLSFSDWLFNKIIPLENKLTEKMIYDGASLGALEMIKSGTTLFMDMYMKMDKVAEVADTSGMKACISKDVLTSSARGGGLIADKEGFEKFYKTFNNSSKGRIKVNMEVHSVYLYDEPSLREAAALAKDMGVSIHIHLLESPSERDTSISMYGLDPLEVCNKFGILDVPVLAAHCVQLIDDNIAMMKDRGITVIHNPSSNLKLGNGVAKIKELLANNINITLGTDGAASNNTLDIFKEIHLASLLQKGINYDSEAASALEVIKMATINGAKALGFTDTGLLGAGKKADVILINLNKPHLNPVNNVISSIAYSMSSSDVDTVIIDGKVIMEKREVLTLDEEKIIYEAQKSMDLLKKI